jgi:hypothetical protein
MAPDGKSKAEAWQAEQMSPLRRTIENSIVYSFFNVDQDH